MFLTPKDIHDKTFKRSFKGYDENEVDEFLDLIIKEFNLMIDENERLRQEITAKPVVQEYSATSVGEIKRLEGMLAQAIETMNKNAQMMAQTGLNVQNINQDMKAREEQEKALEKNNKLEEYKKAVENYKTNFESLIEQQKKQLNEKYKEIFGEDNANGQAFDESDSPSMTGAAFAAAPHTVEPPKEQYTAEKPQFINTGDQQPGVIEKTIFTIEKQTQAEPILRQTNIAAQYENTEPERKAFVQEPQHAPTLKYQGIVNQPSESSEHGSVTGDNRFKPNYSEYAWLYQDKDALNKNSAETANMDITFRNPREKEELKRLIDEVID